MFKVSHNTPRIIPLDKMSFYSFRGQCDCGDCSIYENIEISEGGVTGISRDELYRSNFSSIPVNEDYYFCHNFQDNAAILNSSALQVIDFFRQPHRINDVPLAWREKWKQFSIKEVIDKCILNGLLLSDSLPSHQVRNCSDFLSAWITVTNQCNLNCKYCYSSKNLSKLSFSMGKSIVDAVLRSGYRNQYSKIFFKYAGGEPLLDFELIDALHSYAITQANQNGLVVKGSILSNGTCINQKILSRIKKLNLQLAISLDGLKSYHDCQRNYDDGTGSFEKIIESIKLALRYGITPFISITITNYNMKGLPELLDYILQLGLQFRLNFYRKITEVKEDEFHCIQDDERQFIAAMLNAYEVIKNNLPAFSLLDCLLDHVDLSRKRKYPCSAGKDYLVFDCQGKAYKCQMERVQPITDCYSVDPIQELRDAKQGIENLSVHRKDECDLCELKYWCAGGCPLSAYRTNGRYDAKSPYCNIYKSLYPHVMQLEGLRLLKYGNSLL